VPKETKDSPPPIEAIDLHRSYQAGTRTLEVLRGVSLVVAPGEKLFLCGASGAGKTTLLYTLGGMERPESGEVLVGKEPLYARSRSDRARIRNSAMGFVFQSYQLLPELTALENVCVPAMIDGRDARERAERLLAEVGLKERLTHLPAELSGGEQQRTAIARALVNDPPIILADEPTGNLDSATGKEVMDLLLSLVDAQGKTLIVVTHDSDLAKLGDRTLHIADGQIAD